jgi:DNA-directed RNA polymerase subunit RPC12/RpoP
MSIILPCPACGRTLNVSEQYAGRRIGCPHCGAPVLVADDEPEPRARRRSGPGLFTILGGLFALLLVSCCAIGIIANLGRNPANEGTEQQAGKSTGTQNKPENKSGSKGGLVLLNETLKGTTNQFAGEITGTVVNEGNKTLNYAQIQFNLYDDSGAQVGSAVANINGLEPGGRWNFKAVTFTNKWKTFKMFKLSGF